MRRIRVNAEKILKILSVMPIAGQNSQKSEGCFNYDQLLSMVLIIINLSVCMGQHERMGRSCWLMCLDDTLFQMIVQSALYA